MELFLSNNHVAEIGDNCFVDLNALKSLDLAGNRLTALRSGSFKAWPSFTGDPEGVQRLNY
jgi:Leucine-rich repeat (LRR) protein